MALSSELAALPAAEPPGAPGESASDAVVPVTAASETTAAQEVRADGAQPPTALGTAVGAAQDDAAQSATAAGAAAAAPPTGGSSHRPVLPPLVTESSKVAAAGPQLMSPPLSTSLDLLSPSLSAARYMMPPASTAAGAAGGMSPDVTRWSVNVCVLENGAHKEVFPATSEGVVTVTGMLPQNLVVKDYARGQLPGEPNLGVIGLDASASGDKVTEFLKFYKYLLHGLDGKQPPKAALLVAAEGTTPERLALVPDTREQRPHVGCKLFVRAAAAGTPKPPTPAPVVTPSATHTPKADGTTDVAAVAAKAAMDDLKSTAYVGSNIPAEVRSKRNHLFNGERPEVQELLQVDEVALYSITESKLAERISTIVQEAFGRSQLVIADATAAVGGNTISFARHFSFVHAIEISEQRARMCHNNVTVTGVGAKVHVHHGDARYVLMTIQPPVDVVFFDPPWGGPEYIRQAKVYLYLGESPIGLIVRQLFERQLCKMVALKTPVNFDHEHLMEELGTAGHIHRDETLWKMRLLVIKPGVAPLPSPDSLKRPSAAAPETVASPTSKRLHS